MGVLEENGFRATTVIASTLCAEKGFAVHKVLSDLSGLVEELRKADSEGQGTPTKSVGEPVGLSLTSECFPPKRAAFSGGKNRWGKRPSKQASQ